MKKRRHKSKRRAKPLLSLCTIVRNETRNLPDCLESVRGLVDETVIVDTGSTDGTPDMAQRLGAQVAQAPWPDSFAAARNEALRRASGRWVLWIDADERLRPAEHDRVRRLLRPGPVGAYVVEIMNHQPDGKTPQRSTGHRLFRRLHGVRFRGRVHEQIAPSIERLGLEIRPADFVIDHYGYALGEDEMQRKRQRNLALLQAQLDEEPDNSYAKLQLAQLLMQTGEHAAAEACLRQALTGPALPPDLSAALHNNRAECRLKLGDPEGALQACADSLEIFPRQIMANVLAHQACKALDDFGRAADYLHQARKTAASPAPVGQRPAIEAQLSVREIDRAIRACSARASPRASPAPEETALLLMKSGDPEGALEALRLLEQERPDDPNLKRYIAGVLVKLDRRSEAAGYLATAVARGP